MWADAIYFNVRLSPQRPCVLIGATAKGRKEVIALEYGQRESTLSWQTVLQGLKACRLTQEPDLAISDGVLGFWTSLEEAFPATNTSAVGSTKQPMC